MTIKIFYTGAMVADSQSFSPSAHKPAEVVRSWQLLGVDLEIITPEAVSIEQLARAHDRAFVTDVLAGKRKNGFGNRSPRLPHHCRIRPERCSPRPVPRSLRTA